MRLAMNTNLIREIWHEFNKDLKKALKYNARISEVKNINGKTHFTIQLIGRNICSRWLSAVELIQNKRLFSALSPDDQEYAKSTCRVEFNIGSEDEKKCYFSYQL